MKNFTFFFFLALFLISGIYSSMYAQSDSAKTEMTDSVSSKHDHGKLHKHKHDWNFSCDFVDSHESKDPFITLFYGGSELSMHGLNSDFSRNGFGEAKIGYLSLDKAYKETILIKFNSHYIDISGGSQNLYYGNLSDGLNAQTLQFGLGWSRGYGYNMGNSNIVLTHSFGVNWTRLRLDDTVQNSLDAKKLAYYDNTFRFGINTESGIQAQIIPYLSVNAAYNRSLVYPRVMFWKAAGSILTECIGYGLVDKFVDNIIKSTPSAAPIVNFLLKNGIAYGMYELRKVKMNFPFGDESPMMANTFKVGLTFAF